jgi:hypothetical protein
MCVVRMYVNTVIDYILQCAQLVIITIAFTHLMSSPDSYGGLELDSAVLDELARVEATLPVTAPMMSGPVDQSPSNISNPDSDHPDADHHIHPAPAPPTPEPPSSKTSGCESPFKTSSRALTGCQATQHHDDIFPGTSSGNRLLSPGSTVPGKVPGPSGARQHSTDHELDRRTSGKSNCKQRVRKRKAAVLDEGRDGEPVVSTHQSRPRPSKRSRGQSTRPQSRNRPPSKVLRRIAPGTHGSGNEEPDSDDPIDFLHFRCL